MLKKLLNLSQYDMEEIRFLLTENNFKKGRKIIYVA
jgi:hypothetical protein